MGQPMTRRAFTRRAGLFGAGVAVGVAGLGEAARAVDGSPGPAAATVADRSAVPGRGQLRALWFGPEDGRRVALTFDDGPQPQWTTAVLDILDQCQAPATFFLVGERLRAHPAVLRGRLDRHEVGNHTWRHLDLSRRDQEQAYHDLRRGHEIIGEVLGRTPRLFRPPYGHLSGSAMLAADRLGYDVILWSVQMVEARFPGDPEGHARYIESLVRPGAVLLGHDVGVAGRHRFVTVAGLTSMIATLRARGYTFTTVSDLLA